MATKNKVQTLEEIKKKYHDTARNYIAQRLARIEIDIEKEILKSINGIISAFLGIRKNYKDEWELSPRSGSLSALLEKKSEEVARKIISDYDWIPDENVMKSLEKEFRRIYLRELKEQMEEIVKEQAYHDGLKFVEKISASSESETVKEKE